MDDHPQVNAFLDAAGMLRGERYWGFGSTRRKNNQNSYVRSKTC
jgi:hypothetical protein